MPFAIIQRGIFGPEVIYLRITRRKPPAHLADASLALFGSAIFVFFIKGIGHT